MFEADFLVMSVYVETIHSPSDGGRFPCNLPLPYMEASKMEDALFRFKFCLPLNLITVGLLFHVTFGKIKPQLRSLLGLGNYNKQKSLNFLTPKKKGETHFM